MLPELTPYETSVYLYPLGELFVKSGVTKIRVVKRIITVGYGKAARGEKTSYKQVSKILGKLEEKGCIKVDNTNRERTSY